MGFESIENASVPFLRMFCDREDCMSKQNFLLRFLSSSGVLMQLNSVFLDSAAVFFSFGVC